MSFDRLAAIRLRKDRQNGPKLRFQILGAEIARGKQNRQSRTMTKYPAGQSDAILAAGHLNIREDAVDRAAVTLEKQHGFIRAGGFHDQIPLLPQVIGNLRSNAHIIFDDQNPQARADTAMRLGGREIHGWQELQAGEEMTSK
ncbi:hypothetical protein Q9Q95_14020 [Sphingomonas sp. DG1-23]|nr:hypothetical protein [Sphingomonas sp. DG1-23]MDP5280046.1 hypothetical protein [Sphingomonas sp. DG1-23]